MVDLSFKRNIRRVKYARKLWGYYTGYYLAGRAGKIYSRNYSKFIILGTERTGSNFLRGILNSHSRVIAFGEIFRRFSEIGWDLDFYPRSDDLLKLLQENPVEFLDKKLFGYYPKSMQAVGFKIFYSHAHTEKWQPVWEYLKNLEGLKVIHLKRKNILRTLYSLKKAEMTGKWIFDSPHEKIDKNIFAIDYNECLEFFQKIRKLEDKYDRFFSEKEILVVNYEDLSRNYKSEIEKIEDLLGLSKEDIFPVTYKQNRLPLSKAVQNYAELKEKFSGTEWEEFFQN